MTSRYAAAVVRVLYEDFASELRDPMIEKIVRDAVARQTLNADAAFEVIVDDPISANWRLKPDKRDRGRVRIACYRRTPSANDHEREQRINLALAAIAEE